MNPMEAIVYQQHEDLTLLNSRRELMVKLSRKLLLAVALTSTLGWTYFLFKAARSVGEALFF
jgi:hypothetical protein